MPISVQCPSCRSTFRVKDELAGKRGKCPTCKASITALPATTNSQWSEHGQERRLAPERRSAGTAVPLVVSDLEPGPSSEPDDGVGYALAGAEAKKAPSVGVRQGGLPDVGLGGQAVRQAIAPTAKTRTPAEILAAFQGEIEPVRPSLMYSAWLLIVAGFMILLPLAYLAFIGLVIGALGYHAVYDLAIYQHARGRGAARVALFVYVLPLICGVVMVAFLLKPLFAKPAKRAKTRKLNPQSEPLLFAFIDGVCTSVGAPRPAVIEVNCEVNAAAGHSGGPFSFFSREPVLVIGLGLAAGLDLRQFAGVMAHELGHLAQGSGAWCMDVISSINSWLARAVYERDEWDETLQAWSSDDNGYVIVIGLCARLAVWLTRRVLWVLLHAGHLVNMVFLRQREYDADRYAARMSGAENFAHTQWRSFELDLASKLAMSDLQSSWQQRRLPDNYPKLILANVPQIPKEVLEAYRESLREEKTGLFDTHPSTRDRIARARRDSAGDGNFHLEGKASDVFRDFDALGRQTTFDYYKSLLGRDISKEQLFPVADLVDAQAVAQEGYLAAERFFLKALPMTQPLGLPGDYPKAPADPRAAKQALVNARGGQQAAREACLAAGETHSELYSLLAAAEAGRVLLKCDVRLDASEWGLSTATLRAAESASGARLAEIEASASQYRPFVEAASQRLTQALALLELDQVAERLPDGRARREEARALYPCVVHLATNVVAEIAPTVRAKRVVELVLAKYGEASTKNERLTNAVLRASGDLHARLQELRWKVSDSLEYPFEHATERITLGRYAFPPLLPDKDDLGRLIETTDTAVDRLFSLYQRALGRLTVTAEEVERALRLAPLVFDESS